MRVRAFAKINLGLRVLGRRADGYHELETTFQSIALYDTLTIVATPGPFRIECEDPACPADSTNLVWRAAECMWREARRRGAPRDLAVRIEKRIPVRAGLGGGSSDGAAALRAFATLFRVRPTRARLRAMAAELGADVPYFLDGGTALGLGRGDRVVPLADLPRRWIALVVPRFGIGTRQAFEWWDRARREAGGRRGRPEEPGDLRNDLQRPVTRHHPVLARLVSRLRREGASHAALSGSGSAIFGVFGSRLEAEAASRALAGRTRRAWATRTITRRECRALAGV
jgi:4-diphosphocytidyl-2-C-methyl-D-erythritol kinase